MTDYLNALRAIPDTLWEKLPDSSQRYVQLFWKKDAGKIAALEAPYEKNVLEKIGNAMLFPTVELWHKLSGINTHLAAFGAGAAVALSFSEFINRPVATTALISRTIAFLPQLFCYSAIFTIAGLALRSIGRRINTDLMASFNANLKK